MDRHTVVDCIIRETIKHYVSGTVPGTMFQFIYTAIVGNDCPFIVNDYSNDDYYTEKYESAFSVYLEDRIKETGTVFHSWKKVFFYPIGSTKISYQTDWFTWKIMA